ncbi:hypothetical protein [Thalassotalea aquiviva]|uniref:hypothetical protein n=1 Tax=Thalassotalea aquiviva TaxID=3242415 RepID=UPI00352A76D0
MMKTCKRCAFPIADFEEYCDACEALNANVFECSNCQAIVAPNHPQCQQCGENLTTNKLATTPTQCDDSNPLNSLANTPGCCVRMVVNKNDD